MDVFIVGDYSWKMRKTQSNPEKKRAYLHEKLIG